MSKPNTERAGEPKRYAYSYGHGGHIEDPDGAFVYHDEWVSLKRENAALQSRIDALMLEYCPEAMTPEQIKTWGDSQTAVDTPLTDKAEREGGCLIVSTCRKLERKNTALLTKLSKMEDEWYSPEHMDAVQKRTIDPLRTQLAQAQNERDELKRWAETNPDLSARFQDLWAACNRLVEKAAFKYLFRHMEETEGKLLRAQNDALDRAAEVFKEFAFKLDGKTIAEHIISLKSPKSAEGEPG